MYSKSIGWKKNAVREKRKTSGEAEKLLTVIRFKMRGSNLSIERAFYRLLRERLFHFAAAATAAATATATAVPLCRNFSIYSLLWRRRWFLYLLPSWEEHILRKWKHRPTKVSAKF